MGLLLFVPGLGFRIHLARLRRLAGTFLGIRFPVAGTTDRKIADVPHAGLHDVVITKVLVDGLGLGGRLHDYQTFTHNGENILRTV